MILPCRMCERPVSVSLLTWLKGGPAFCPPSEVDTCIGVFTARHLSPPEEDPEPDPDTIPPEDIAICGICKGSGEVFVRKDWQTGAYVTAKCAPCEGTGEWRPAWMPSGARLL